MDNFGRPSMIYAVETFCIAVPTDTCQKCEEVCEGDYWHKDYATFLCQLCWQEEKYIHEFYSRERLKEFKVYRPNVRKMKRHYNIKENNPLLKLTFHKYFYFRKYETVRLCTITKEQMPP